MTEIDRGLHGGLGRAGGIRLTHALAVLIIVLFTLPVLGIFLGTGDPANTMEMFNLVPVHEAVRDGHWLMPTLNGLPRFEKPPLCVWMPGSLAWLVGSDSLWVVRSVSVLMAVFTAIATYGIGTIVFRNRKDSPAGERWYALLAALFVPAMFAFDRHARLASYDIYATAFALGCAYFILAVAEGSCADRRISRARATTLTVLAGLCLAGSMMCKGPAPAATVLAPLLVWLAIFHRRRAVWLAVAAMIAVGILAAIPWVAAVMIRYPEALAFWKGEVFKLWTSREADAPSVMLDTRRPWFYYVQIFLWVAPFTPLFVAGLVLPFLKSRGEIPAEAVEKRGRWLAWIVVIGGLVMLSIPSVKELRYAIQILPFAALLCAAVAQEFVRTRQGEKLDLGGAAVLAAQGLCFILPAAGGIAAASWLLIGKPSPHWAGGDAMRAAITSVGAPAVLALCLALLLAAIIMWRWYERRAFFGAAALLILCAWLMAVTVNWAGRADPANHRNAWRNGLERAAKVVGQDKVVALYTTDIPPWLSTLYYLDRNVPVIKPAAMEVWAAEHPDEPVDIVVISPTRGDGATEMQSQLDTMEQVTRRKGESLIDFTAENRRIRIVRLVSSVLLIDAAPDGTGMPPE